MFKFILLGLLFFSPSVASAHLLTIEEYCSDITHKNVDHTNICYRIVWNYWKRFHQHKHDEPPPVKKVGYRSS